MIYRYRDMIYGLRRMIYLLRKYDIISVPSYAEGIYHRSYSDIISKIYHPFRQERISLKKRTFVGRQKFSFSWYARLESNQRSWGFARHSAKRTGLNGKAAGSTDKQKAPA